MFTRPTPFPYLTALLLAAAVAGMTGCGGRFSGPPGPAAISLNAADRELEAGEEAALAVEVTDFSGRAIPNAAVTWETSNPDIAQVTATGHTARVKAGQQGGTVTITARAGTHFSQVELTIKGIQPRPVSFSQDVLPIFTRSCALPDCHGGPEDFLAEGLSLEPGFAYDQTVGVPALQVRSGGVNRVEPGQPDRSYLIAKIRGTHRQLGGRGAQMPLDGSLPESDLATIVKWVEEGAPRN